MKKYIGFSLVETLITIFIMAMVLLLLNVTLITMVKTSGIATGRTVSRQETEYMIEVIRRYVRNSDSEHIKLYNTKGVRVIRKTGDTYSIIDGGGIGAAYGTQLADGAKGNEIHFQPSGSSQWVCIAFFYAEGSTTDGYAVKSTTTSNDPINCFNSSTTDFKKNFILLNSDSITVQNFDTSYYRGNVNVYFTVDMTVKPVYWAPGDTADIKPEYQKSVVIQTRKQVFNRF